MCMHEIHFVVYGHVGDREETFNGPVSFGDEPDSLFYALCAKESWEKWAQMWHGPHEYTDDVEAVVYDKHSIVNMNTVNAIKCCKKHLQKFQDGFAYLPKHDKLYVIIRDAKMEAAELEEADKHPQFRPANARALRTSHADGVERPDVSLRALLARLRVNALDL